MKIFPSDRPFCPHCLSFPRCFAADEQTMIVSAAPQVVSELDTPAAVSVVDGEEMRTATPRINLSESLTGCTVYRYKTDRTMRKIYSCRFADLAPRSTYGIRGIRLYVDGIPATMPDGQGQTSNIDLSSVQNVEVLRGPFSALYGNASGDVMNVTTRPDNSHQPLKPVVTTAVLAAGAMG